MTMMEDICILHMSKSVRSLSRNSNGGITKYDRMRSRTANNDDDSEEDEVEGDEPMDIRGGG